MTRAELGKEAFVESKITGSLSRTVAGTVTVEDWIIASFRINPEVSIIECSTEVGFPSGLPAIQICPSR